MTKDEALKLALEALKAKDTWGSSIRDAKEKAIKALEEALAQPAQGPDLSGLKPATQEAIKGWIADRTVVERAVGVMFEQEREISRLEKLAAAQPASPECKTVAEQTAYAFGWWKALESVKTGQPAQEPWKSSDTAHRPGGLPQDFTAHEVELFGDWSEWVSPDSEQYFMKCCDCGLVHEMQFKVAKYSEGDECEFVADADLQAVFRARRATPPAAQPAQEPVAWICYGATGKRDIDFYEADIDKLPIGTQLYTTPQQRPWVGLTHQQTKDCVQAWDGNDAYILCRAIEKASKEKNT